MYVTGDRLRSEVEFTSDGSPADPDVVELRVRLSGEEVHFYKWPDDAEIVKTAVGTFRSDWELSDVGSWTWSWRAEPVLGFDDPSQAGACLVGDMYLKSVRPTPAAIAATRQSRTYVDDTGDPDVPAGSAVLDFTEDTTPTLETVEKLIDEHLDDVQSVFSSGVIPEGSWPDARRAIVCRVALAIEIGDPDMTIESSPFLQLRQEATAAMKALTDRANVRGLFAE